MNAEPRPFMVVCCATTPWVGGGGECTGENVLWTHGHLIWKKSMSNWEDNLRAFFHFILLSPGIFQHQPISPSCSLQPHVLSPKPAAVDLLGKNSQVLVSDKAGQPKCYNSSIGAESTHQFYFLALWCRVLRFLWQLKGEFTFLLFLSTSGNMVVAVSSLILSPKSLRKSHGYLFESPWQWRKRMFRIFFFFRLVSPSLGWTVSWSQSGLAGSSHVLESWVVQTPGWWGQEALVRTFFSSWEDEWKFKYVSLPTWVFTQNDTEFGFLSSGCCSCNSLHWECPLDPCSLNGLAGPIPLKQKK